MLCVSDCPDFPDFQLSESRSTLEDMGINNIDDVRLEQYSQIYHTFILVSVRHRFTLTTDCVIILRRKGVHMQNEAEIITHFVEPSTPSHQRYELSQERRTVRQEYKAMKGPAGPKRAVAISLSSESDGEVEVVRVSRKRPVKTPSESGSDLDKRPRWRARPNLVIDTTISPIDVDSMSASPSATPSALWSAQSSTATPSTTPPPSATPSDSPSWMTGMYTVDMVEGLLQMDSKKLAHLSKKDRFAKVFGPYRFVPSTYNDQALRWKSASAEQRERAQNACRTPAGLWARFVKEVPLRR